MGPFSKAKDHRNPQPQESDDYVPLLPVRRGSRSVNIWNTEEDDQELSPKRNNRLPSGDPLYRLVDSEDGDIEDTDGSSGTIHGKATRYRKVGFEKLETQRLVRSIRDSLSSESPTNLGEDSNADDVKPFEDDSPYEEVRAAVSNIDDSAMACVFHVTINI